MKKIDMSLFVLLVCFALSFLACALPIIANINFNSFQEVILERATPKEYMNDFVRQDIIKNDKAVFFTEEEIIMSKLAVIKAFKTKFKVEIPDNLIFNYTASGTLATNDNKISINMTWSGTKYFTIEESTLAKEISFSSALEVTPNLDLQNQPALITSIETLNGIDDAKITNYETIGISAFKKELNMIVPKNYIYDLKLFSYLGSEKGLQKQGNDVHLFWYDQKQKSMYDNGEIDFINGYSVGFYDVDLITNTGTLKWLEKTSSPFTQRNEATIGTITDEKRNEMLDIAKKFLSEKNLLTGNLRNATPPNLEGNIMFRFDAIDMRYILDNTVYVVVSPKLEILGYQY